MSVRRVLPWLAIAVVMGGLVLAFVSVGTPGHARLAALDRIRIANLYEITSAVHDRFDAGNGLPATLPSDLKSNDFGTVGTRGNYMNDPASGTPYEYDRVDRNTYRLCATFALSYHPMRPPDRLWKHPRGHTCYDFDVHKIAVDPEANGFEGEVGGSPPF